MICSLQTEKMIVAITGATGFIGSKLVKRLAAGRYTSLQKLFCHEPKCLDCWLSFMCSFVISLSSPTMQTLSLPVSYGISISISVST